MFLTIFSYFFLFFSSLLLAHSLTQFCQTALSPQSYLLGLLFSLGLHFFSLPQMVEWPFPFIYFFFSSFLPSTLFLLYHNKCKSLTLTLLHPKSFFFSSLLGWMAFVSFFFFFFNVSNTPKPPNPITYADFCTWWRKDKKH